MYTNTFNYLQTKLNIKSILLAFISAILLSACGVKGDLYQTPERATAPSENAKDTVIPKSKVDGGSLNEAKKEVLQVQPTQPLSQSSNHSEIEQA